MATESRREVTLAWPIDPSGMMSGGTLADVKAAWAAWIAELEACDAPDNAPVGYYSDVMLRAPGLIARWDDPKTAPTS